MHGMDTAPSKKTRKTENPESAPIDSTTLSQLLGALSANKEIKITGSSTIVEHYRTNGGWENMKWPKTWEHDLTISVVDKQARSVGYEDVDATEYDDDMPKQASSSGCTLL